MMRAMLTPPSGARLSGQPVKLVDVIRTGGSRADQLQRVETYWDLCSSVADYYLGLREQDELQKLRASVSKVGPTWQQAESELGVRIGTSQRAAVASQYRLASMMGRGGGDSLPLPADLPHCGDYYARFSQVFAGRQSAEAQQLSERRALPGELFVEIPADAFSQINVAVNQKLVAAVTRGAELRKLTTFCDLFAGVGNFALPLSRLGLSGVMVERTPSAVQAAQRAAAEQGLSRLKARTADAARALSDLVREGQRFELVVLDPPREGAPEVVAGIPGLEPRAVAYVACDPATLSRDLKPLVAAGLRVVSVQPFDMFPRTHHFETLVWLEAPPKAGTTAG